MFKLPAYQDLSQEQDEANNLPLDGIHLIAGPPGTGKTVVGIYRAELCSQKKISYEFVVFNNVLRQYLNTVFVEKHIDGSADTLFSWFGTWYGRLFHSKVPQTVPYIYDWEAINNCLSSISEFTKYDQIIIDEGQDFPKELFWILKCVSKNLTVLADDNQRLTEQNSTVEQVKNYLGVDKVHFLTRNYRNSRPIAVFASNFFSGLSGGVPSLPERNGALPRIYLGRNNSAQIDIIARYANNNPEKTVGVFLKDQGQQVFFYNEIKSKVPAGVQTYLYNDSDHKEIDFCMEGIIVLSYKSAKGLEFDSVFLPSLELIRTDANADGLKMELYVLVSRAREELNLLTSNNTLPFFIEGISNTQYRIIP